MESVKWLRSVEDACRESELTGRLVLLFFHHMEKGSERTLGYTLRDSRVIEMVEAQFAPASFVVTEAQEMAARYNIEWTPTFIITDEHGRELERWVGYLPPEEFLAQARLAEGLADLHRGRYRDAGEALEWVVDNSPDSELAPEARYFMGVAMFKITGDLGHLQRTWEAMSRRYPGNYWTKKASAWS